jgi:hypothetical protein
MLTFIQGTGTGIVGSGNVLLPPWSKSTFTEIGMHNAG